MLTALRHGTYRWLFAAQASSALAHFSLIVAVAALLVDGGADAGDLGLVLAAQALGVVVFAFPGGVLSDRLPRRGMMIAADATRAVGTIAMLSAGGEAPLAVLAALALFIGAGEAIFQPAYRGLLPRVLPDELLQSGNALGSLSQQFALFLGPALAGVVIAALDPSAGLVLAALTFAGSAAMLLAVAEERPEPTDRDGSLSLLADAAEGIRALRDRPWIAWVIAMATVHLLVAIAPFEILLPIISEDEYGAVAVYGWLLAAMGAGALLGAIAGARIRTAQPGTMALVALVPFCLLLLALAVAIPLGPLIGVLLLAGAGEAIFDILWTTGLQRDVPDHLLSRVISLDWLGSLALLPLGLALTGTAVDEFGRSAVLAFGAGLAFLLLLPLLLSGQVRRFSSAPASGG